MSKHKQHYSAFEVTVSVTSDPISKLTLANSATVGGSELASDWCDLCGCEGVLYLSPPSVSTLPPDVLGVLNW